jgi:NNP family nitrate/nitrite transporter-like MFS transporter
MGRSYRGIIAPLKHVRVWEYSLQYVVVFGAYVALSLVLPKYLLNVYGQEIREIFGIGDDDQSATSVLRVASLLTTLFIFPASLMRPVGGWMSDKWGAVRVTSGVFVTMIISGGMLSFPLGLGLWPFVTLLFILGCGMGFGKAAVFKLIPDHFPHDVGSVGGMVGMLGALGGFFLPPLWVYLDRWTGIPQITFGVLTLLTLLSAAWFLCAQALLSENKVGLVEPVVEGVRS